MYIYCILKVVGVLLLVETRNVTETRQFIKTNHLNIMYYIKQIFKEILSIENTNVKFTAILGSGFLFYDTDTNIIIILCNL